MSLPFERLRYVRLGARNLDTACSFAFEVLGLQPVGCEGPCAYFRSDFRDHTLCFVAGDPDEQAIAFDVYRAETLEDAANALVAAGYAVHRGDAAACAARRVKAFISVRDSAGTTIEVVWRPQMTAVRYFPSRDVGIVGLQSVALRSADPAADERLWSGIFNGQVSDWVGDVAYLKFDALHHRIALHPSAGKGVLAVEYEVESMDHMMRAFRFLEQRKMRIVHGPGRQPTSGQIFLTFEGPTGVLFSLVTGMNAIDDVEKRRPRQFPLKPESFCEWGTVSALPEFGGRRPVLVQTPRSSG
jgi:2,3-dihydroxy-p-cumate/2,3-dihydroxybenzoate 3,4-dioxygenase